MNLFPGLFETASGGGRRIREIKDWSSEKYEHDRDAYTRAKTDFVRECTKKARKEFGDIYRPDGEKVKKFFKKALAIF